MIPKRFQKCGSDREFWNRKWRKWRLKNIENIYIYTVSWCPSSMRWRGFTLVGKLHHGDNVVTLWWGGGKHKFKKGFQLQHLLCYVHNECLAWNMKSHAFKYLSSACRCNLSPNVRSDLTNQERTGTSFYGGKKITMCGHCEKNKNWLNPSLVMAIKSTGSSREPPRKYDRASPIELFVFFFFSLFFLSQSPRLQICNDFSLAHFERGPLYCALDEGTIFWSHCPGEEKKKKKERPRIDCGHDDAVLSCFRRRLPAAPPSTVTLCSIKQP